MIHFAAFHAIIKLMDTLANLSPDFLCTDVSIAMDEPLYGTAAQATTWFILEYREPWAPKAPNDNQLPKKINNWLNDQLDQVANGRLQFIRRKVDPNTLYTFYIGITHETDQRLYKFELPSYDNLLSLDIPAVLSGDDSVAQHLSNDPLVIVCTHGKRDRCCALYGLPILNAFQTHFGKNVWQTTHTGGHRFAPTLITFPDGTCYGRLTVEDVPQVVEALQNGTIFMEKLRGRSCYTSVEQIADYLLRHETSQNQLSHYNRVKTETAIDNQFVVTFEEPLYEQCHIITIEKESNPLSLYASSGSFKIKDVPQFTFVSHEVTFAQTE